MILAADKAKRRAEKAKKQAEKRRLKGVKKTSAYSMVKQAIEIRSRQGEYSFETEFFIEPSDADLLAEVIRKEGFVINYFSTTDLNDENSSSSFIFVISWRDTHAYGR
jgi:hypothetical protein